MEEIKSTLEAEINRFRNYYFSHMVDYEDDSDAITSEMVSNTFYSEMVKTAMKKKSALREMLRNHPNWDETHQMIKLPIKFEVSAGEIFQTRRILVSDIFDMIGYNKRSEYGTDRLWRAFRFFFENENEVFGTFVEEIFPKCYHPNKKITRIFRAVCKELGILTANGFERLYAEWSDVTTSGNVENTNLYLSISPAHFLSMSNPKYDERGKMMNSCHSFNSNEYVYSQGCSGYINDDVTMIAFTVSDEKNEETFYNRKTSRQLFMFDDGILVQSRLYNTNGGTSGTNNRTKVYREAVQEALAICLDHENHWKTCNYTDNQYKFTLFKGDDFGGYPDWEFEEFCAKLSFFADKDIHFESFEAGGAGTCIECGEYLSNDDYMICSDCYHYCTCDHCECGCDEDDLTRVHDDYNNEILVCDNCLEEYYERSEYDNEYYPNTYMTYLEGIGYVHDDQVSDYVQCDRCGDYMLECNAHYDDEDNCFCTYCDGVLREEF